MEDVSDISHYAIFDIDIELDEPSQVSFTEEQNKGFQPFLRRLARNTRVAKSTREMEFDQDSQTKDFLEQYIANRDVETVTMKISRKLHSAELKNSSKMKNLSREIKKGSLIIATFSIGGDKHVMLAKIDFEKFFERDTFDKKLGLPEDKNLLKSCLIKVEQSNSLANPLLFDTNGSISQFWREGFLETHYLRDDEVNTDTAYRSLCNSLTSVSKVSKEDHRLLKNNLIGYFTTSEYYNHDGMVEYVLGDYEPFNPEVKVEKIKEKFANVASKGRFDGSFKIIKGAIKDKIKKTYNLDNGVDLVANAGTHNIFRAKYRNENYVLVKSKIASDDFTEINLED